MPRLNLAQFVTDFADALKVVDTQGPIGRSTTRTYQPGVGPLQEREAVRLVAAQLAMSPAYSGIGPSRYPGLAQECDLVIPGEWAIEIKLARPFGDNGKPAEHWSENLVHPYPGNTSAVGDALKLRAMSGQLAKAVIVFGFEHKDAITALEPAIRAFELVAAEVAGVALGPRHEAVRTDLIHPAHQVLRVYGWEVLPVTKGVSTP